jgi:gluconokinase
MKPGVIIIMGVAGSGKTTVGKALANNLNWDFFDGDDFHSAENIAKMEKGVPLSDDDRSPWLAALHELIVSCMLEQRPCVLACSALKKHYRQALVSGIKGVEFIYLKGSYELIRSRLMRRHNHYMKPEMLKSQFDSLEEPTDGFIVDGSMTFEEIVTKIIDHFSI